jgi:hypothetical protein
VQGDGILSIAELDQVSSLRLSGTDIVDCDLEQLAKAPFAPLLTSLDISSTCVTVCSGKCVRHAPRLYSMSVAEGLA